MRPWHIDIRDLEHLFNLTANSGTASKDTCHAYHELTLARLTWARNPLAMQSTSGQVAGRHLVHCITGGIAGRRYSKTITIGAVFLNRLGGLLKETCTSCFVWVLIPSLFRQLLRTGTLLAATVMRCLFTGYTVSYNRRHHRWSHLFQNRYP